MSAPTQVKIWLCPVCSDVQIKPCTDDDPRDGEQELTTDGIALKDESDYGEIGYSRGVYLTQHEAMECVLRHDDEAREDENADRNLREQEEEEKARRHANEVTVLGSMFDDAVMPADWAERPADDVLAEVKRKTGESAD